MKMDLQQNITRGPQKLKRTRKSKPRNKIMTKFIEQLCLNNHLKSKWPYSPVKRCKVAE